MSFEIKFYVLKEDRSMYYAENGAIELEDLEDEQFIEDTEDNGVVYGFTEFINEVELGHFGSSEDGNPYSVRAYFVDKDSVFPPLRLDFPNITFDTINPNLEEVGEPVADNEVADNEFNSPLTDGKKPNISIREATTQSIQCTNGRLSSLILVDKGKYIKDSEEKALVMDKMSELARQIGALALQLTAQETVPFFDLLEYATDNDKDVQISCDTANQSDEFYIYVEGSGNFKYGVEVVTKEVAEANDQDFGADKDNSYYDQLGDSDYYFRLL